mmetsp:Transcript_102792/g.193274  ORF Transcript_102792/g.193274 Transcript_102792/m.193274 type:complete len:241 (+) Transcript_102792:60-782(+)
MALIKLMVQIGLAGLIPSLAEEIPTPNEMAGDLASTLKRHDDKVTVDLPDEAPAENTSQALQRAVRFESVVDLDHTNYEKLTHGKTVFIKFFADWCPNSRKMALDWLELSTAFHDHHEVLIGQANCPRQANLLCEELEIHAFPTLKYGNPHDLQEYKGERTYYALKNFTEFHLSDGHCGPDQMDLCPDVTKEKLEKYMTFTIKKLEGRMRVYEKKVAEEAYLMKRTLDWFIRKKHEAGEI